MSYAFDLIVRATNLIFTWFSNTYTAVGMSIVSFIFLCYFILRLKATFTNSQLDTGKVEEVSYNAKNWVVSRYNSVIAKFKKR